MMLYVLNTQSSLSAESFREHGGNPGLGQNLASSAGYRQTGQQTVDAWMSEESDYDPANPVHSHFTRMYHLLILH